MPPTTLSKTASTRLTPELDSFLDAECVRLRVTRSEYLRLFVAKKYLDKKRCEHAPDKVKDSVKSLLTGFRRRLWEVV